MSEWWQWLAVVVPIVLFVANLIVPETLAKRRLRLDLEIVQLIYNTNLAVPMEFRNDLQHELETVLRPRARPWKKWTRGLRRGQLYALLLACSFLWLASFSWSPKDAAFWVPLIPGVYLIVAAVHDLIWLSWDRYRMSRAGRFFETRCLLPADHRYVRAIAILNREDHD